MTALRSLALAAALALCAAPTLAAPAGLQLEASVAPPPPGAPTASGRLRVAAPGGDELRGIASPDFARVEVHSMDMAGGVMRMRPVPGPWRVPPGGVLDLSPATGRHLMLVGPKRPLHAGDRVRLELRFARAGRRVVEAPVRAERP